MVGIIYESYKFATVTNENDFIKTQRDKCNH